MAKQGHARAPCLSVPALWRHQTASDFTALRSPGELGGGSPAVFSSSIPCAPHEGDCRDWKRVGFSSGEGGGAISLFCDQHSKITRAGVIYKINFKEGLFRVHFGLVAFCPSGKAPLAALQGATLPVALYCRTRRGLVLAFSCFLCLISGSPRLLLRTALLAHR